MACPVLTNVNESSYTVHGVLRQQCGDRFSPPSILDDHDSKHIKRIGRCKACESNGVGCDLKRKTTGSCTSCEKTQTQYMKDDTWVRAQCDGRSITPLGGLRAAKGESWETARGQVSSLQGQGFPVQRPSSSQAATMGLLHLVSRCR